MSTSMEYGESLIKLSSCKLQALIDQTEAGIARYGQREKELGRLTAFEYRAYERLLNNQTVHIRAQSSQNLTLLLMTMLRCKLMGAYWNESARK